jgi:hypothetical protein
MYWELLTSACFEHYLIILRRHNTNDTWYIACLLCQLAAPGLNWNYIYICLLALISKDIYEEYWSFQALLLVHELLILYNVNSSQLTCTLCLGNTLVRFVCLYVCMDEESSLWRWTWQRVPKRRQNLIRRRGNTQKKTYKFQNTAKIW